MGRPTAYKPLSLSPTYAFLREETASVPEIPLGQLKARFRKTVASGNLAKLESLSAATLARYPTLDIAECHVNAEPIREVTLLALATELGHVDIARWLLGQGVESSGNGLSKTTDDETILHIAARKGHLEIIDMYHAKMSEVYDDPEYGHRLIDWPDCRGMSSISVACRLGVEDSATLLLHLGASIDSCDASGDTALHHASAFGHLALIRLLILHGANAFAKNNAGYTPSDYAYSFGVEQEIQNTVRHAMEVSKRARQAKAAAGARLKEKERKESELGSEEGEEPRGAFPFPNVSNSPPVSSSSFLSKSLASSKSSNSQKKEKPLPASPVFKTQHTGPVSLKISTSSTPSTPALATAPPKTMIASPLIGLNMASLMPIPSPGLDAESSKSIHRIALRDQRAQASFQASSLFKSLTASQSPRLGSSAAVNHSYFPREGPQNSKAGSTSPSTKDETSAHKTPPYSQALSNLLRSRSYSNELTYSSSSTASTSLYSSSASPNVGMGLMLTEPSASSSYSLSPAALLGLPSSLIPSSSFAPASSSSKEAPHKPSLGSSFRNRLKRSGSNGLSSPGEVPASFFAPPATPSSSTFGKGKKGALKQYASIADLRGQSAEQGDGQAAGGTGGMPQSATKSAFGPFTRSRARAGT